MLRILPFFYVTFERYNYDQYDFVILSRGQASEVLKWTQKVMEHIEVAMRRSQPESRVR